MTSVVFADIPGVVLVNLSARADERGRFVETFRQEWFPDAPPMVQGNRSDSKAGVLRGLHFHLKQADYWYAPYGRILVALHDLRRSSPTQGDSMSFEIGEGADLGVYIPPGVAHGFQAVTDATLTYLVDQYYDASDEQGVAWDDPDAAIPWPLADPILSDRDKQNPKRADIAEGDLPA
ncbi:MAG: dTDP-4-dehydrorhamnose 3,5-epimerase family protein [Actinomycetota bacterium]